MTPTDPDGSAGRPRKERRRYRRRRQRRSTPGWLQNSPPEEMKELVGAMGQTRARGGTQPGLRLARRVRRQIRHLLRGLHKESGRVRPGKPSESGHRHHRHRKRHRTPAPIRWLRNGPAGELAELISLPFRRHPLALSLGAASTLWWFWPWIRPPAEAGPGVPDVIAVETTDHMWTTTALTIWRSRPGATLALMNPPGPSARFSLTKLRDANLTPEERRRVVRIDVCGDIITEMTDLSLWLKTLAKPGQLLLITGAAHIDRMTAVGKVMAGSEGWAVQGVGSVSSEHKPESPLKVVRDQLRAQLWRATGWSGKDSLICPGRAQGLF